MKKKIGAVLLVLALALTLGVVPAASVLASSEPVILGLWHLDEGSGASTVSDSSGNGNNGTIYGATPGITGKFGNALSFDGNDYVQLPASNSILNTDTFTIEAWFKTSVNHPAYGSGEGRMVNFARGADPLTALALYLEQDNIAVCYHNGTEFKHLKYTVNYYDDVWHHVAVTHDATTFRLYYDGEEKATQADDFGVFGTSPAYIGTYNSSERFFNGIIDEVRIWDRDLIADDIAFSYSGSVAWLPPVTHSKFALKGGTTLPLKFRIFDGNGLVNTVQPVSLEITGPEGFDAIIFQLGSGVKNLRWNADKSLYIANLKTKVGEWPEGAYTATVHGIVTGTITFDLSRHKGINRGNKDHKGNKGNKGK